MSIADDALYRAVCGAIDLRVKEIVDDEAKKASAAVERRIRELVPQVVCGLNRQFQIEMGHDAITIRVNLTDKRGNPPPGPFAPGPFAPGFSS